jgi:hypothetical protein
MNLRLDCRKRKGQVFSIDVLFAILPVIMIIGASLQYMYLAEEDLKSMVLDNQRGTIAQGLSDAVMAEYFKEAKSGKYHIRKNCDDFETEVLNDADDILHSDYDRYIYAWDYYNNTENDTQLCKDTGSYDSWFLLRTNNTLSSQERFMLMGNSSNTILPGQIAGVSIAVWEDIP